MAEQIDIQKAEKLLYDVLQPMKAKSVTAKCKRLCKKPNFLLCLLSIVNLHSELEIRQLAAVMIKKNLLLVWEKLTTEQQTQIKGMLLTRCFEEPSMKICEALCSIVSKLCLNIWDDWQAELFQKISQLFSDTSAQPQYKERGMILLQGLIDLNGDKFLEKEVYITFVIETTIREIDQARIVLAGQQPDAVTTNQQSLFQQSGNGQINPLVMAKSICENALKCLDLTVSILPSEYSTGFVPQTVDILLALIQTLAPHFTEYDSILTLAFEIITKAVFLNVSTFPREKLETLLRAFIELISNPKQPISAAFTEEYSNMLLQAVKKQPTMFIKPSCALLSDIFRYILALAYSEKKFISLEWEQDNDDGDSNSEHFDEMDFWSSTNIPYVCQFVSECIDILISNLPKKLVYEEIMIRLRPHFTTHTPEKKYINLIILAIVVSGCQTCMSSHIQEYLPMVLEPFKMDSFDNKNRLITAASIALTQIIDYMQTESLRYYQDILNTILPSLAKYTNEPRVFKKISAAAESLFENLTPDQVLPYLRPQIAFNLELLMNDSSKLEVKKSCLKCLSHVVKAGKHYIKDYAASIFQYIQFALNLTEKDLAYSLRRNATLCAGNLILSLFECADVSSYADYTTHHVLQSLESDDDELIEASFQHFSSLCIAFKDAYASKFLPKAMEAAIAVLLRRDDLDYEDSFYDSDSDSDEESHKHTYNSAHDNSQLANINGLCVNNAFPQGEQKHNQSLSLEDKSLFFHDTLSDLQEGAFYFLIDAYRYLSMSTMFLYFDQVYECIELHMQSLSPESNTLACTVLQVIVYHFHIHHLPDWARAFEKLYNYSIRIQLENQRNEASHLLYYMDENRGWLPGLPAQKQVHNTTFQLWQQKVIPLLFNLLKNNTEKEVIGEVCEMLGETLEVLGPHLLEVTDENKTPAHILLLSTVELLLKNQHGCQLTNEELTVDMDIESREIEEALFEGVSYLICGLAKTLGEQFIQYFNPIFESLLKLVYHRKSSAYRSIGIGTCAEIFRALKQQADVYIDQIFSALLEAIKQTEDLHLKRNALYCYGVIFESSVRIGAGKNEDELLRLIQPLCEILTKISRDVEENAVIDNTVAALGRAIRFLNLCHFPDIMTIITPLFLRSLPLREDFEESECILKTLFALYETDLARAILASYMPEFLKAFVAELSHAYQLISQKTLEKSKQIICDVAQSPEGVKELEMLAELYPKFKTYVNDVVKK